MKIKTGIVLSIIFIFSILPIISAQESRVFMNDAGVLDSVSSKVLNENRSFYVRVPDSYSQNQNKKYPVAYLLDGEVFLPTLTDVHYYYSGGFMPEMVLVGVSNNKNRTRDLTTSKIDTWYGMPYNIENGEAGNFMQFLETELIPYVNENYPVNDYRTLIGHSYGGLFTIYALIKHSELFDNYLAIDPSLDWDDWSLLKEAKVSLDAKKLENKSLFISLNGQLHMGNSAITIDNVMEDSSDFTSFARANLEFSSFLKQLSGNGFSYDWKFYQRDLHGTIILPSMMDGLISIFDWFQMENTDMINSFETSNDELKRIIHYRAEKLEKHFGYPAPPYPEDLLNMSGYMNMDMQNFEKAKMYFELALQYYPESANVYDSMADYYESLGEIDKAISFVSKAYEINKEERFKERISNLEKKK